MSHPFPAQAHFPEGTRLAVKEPYLKLSNAGTLTVRVDDPSNVVVLDRPGDGDEALVDPEALKARGNALYQTWRSADEFNKNFQPTRCKAVKAAGRV